MPRYTGVERDDGVVVDGRGAKNRPITGSSQNDSARATAIDAGNKCSGES